MTLRSLLGTLKLSRRVRCRIPRWLASASRISTTPGLIILAGTQIALAGIPISSAGIVLAENLFSGESRIIGLHLFIFAGVDTPIMSPADMRG